MRHGYFGYKLSRTKNERRQLFRSMLRDLITHGRIQTTVTRAKAVRPLAEKLVTKAKAGDDNSRRQVLSVLTDRKYVDRLFTVAKSDEFAGRTSGFTRIVRLGQRSGDNAQEVMFMFVDQEPFAHVPATEEKKPAEAKKTPAKKETKPSRVKKEAAEPKKKSTKTIAKKPAKRAAKTTKK